MKKFLNIVLGLFFAGYIYGQQDATYTQNMFNQMAINPAYAGSQDMICITALNRQQWMGFDGAPVSGTYSVNAPFTLFEKQHGVGLTVIRNVVGYNTNIGLNGAYAFRKKMQIGDGMMSGGISFGFQNGGLDASKLGGTSADQFIPTGKQSVTVFNFGLGLYYKNDKVYFGLSTNNLISGSKKYTNGLSTYTPTRYIYITSGYKYQLPNPMYQLEPSFFIQTDGSTSVLNLNTNLVYNNRVWGGLSYRAGTGAISALFGLEIRAGIRIGMAYDYETSDLNTAATKGSLEFAVIYCFNLKKEKIPQRYKSIRFL